MPPTHWQLLYVTFIIVIMAVRRRKRNLSPEWEYASDITERIHYLLSVVDIPWVDPDRIFCFRSYQSSARAYARIWGFSKIWQIALHQKPAYAIEVLSEKFDSLSQNKKDEILLHELCHIPQTFSGALLPHTRKGTGSFHGRLKQLVTAYNKIR